VTGDSDRTPSDRVDVCVVGAGPAGALVAEGLAKRGHEVVVLEAGKRFDTGERIDRMERSLRPAHDPLSVWDMGGERDAYTSTGEWEYPLNRSRVKGVGGTTLSWQGLVMRLHEGDFEMESKLGVASDWPIDYEELRPYYARAEEALGVAGASDNPFEPSRETPHPMPAFPPSYSDSIFAEACERLGVAMHSVPNARNSEPYDGDSQCVGFGTCKPVCPTGAKYDATRTLDEAPAEDVRVIDRVPVQRLEHDDAGRTIEAAVYATPEGQTYRQTAREFVIACGGVETPRLLLLSESDTYPDGLANSSGNVGRYFMEHMFAGTGAVIDRRTRQNHVGFLTSETHQFYDDPTAGTEQGIDEAVDNPSEFTPLKLEFFNYAPPSPVEMALESDVWGDELLQSLNDAYGNSIAMGGLVGQRPRKENFVGLDPNTTDDHGNPVPRIHWHVDEVTKRTIRRANEIQETILAELDADITWQVGPEETGPAFHHMGTTRMGTDPDESVVTPRMRTHDLDNLWIGGSSVFVTSGAMNPTLTIAALALKLVDHLHEEL
jgi:choline dehydrogenase-like flavoprotein